MSKRVDPLGDRMKKYYESSSQSKLVRRMPAILRLDGCHFHSYTKGLDKPFSDLLSAVMLQTMCAVCKEFSGTRFVYQQSDEISFLLIDYEKLDTEAWFAGNIQKIVSVSASIFSVHFNQIMGCSGSSSEALSLVSAPPATFDARVFNIPKEEVCNYFLWRQQDATRNSIQMVAQANFPHKSLQNLNSSQLQEKLFQEKGINWDDTPTRYKRGQVVYRTEGGWVIDQEIPIFSQDRDYVEKHL